MDNNIDFKEMWAGQTTPQPNIDDLHVHLNKLKKSNLRKLIITNTFLITTSLIIIFIWIYYQPQLFTTKIGIVLTILSMAIYLFAYNQSFSLFKNTTNTQSNNEYLKNLMLIKSKQQFLQTTMLNLYFILLSLGIGLYMYEYTLQMSLLGGLFAYFITSIWVLFNWIYLRPRQINKQQAKIDELVRKFEILSKQLED